MLITKKSMASGIVRTREIDCTQEQLDLWRSGHLIQSVMNHLSDDDREFLMTGIVPGEWEEMFPDDDDQYCTEEEAEAIINQEPVNLDPVPRDESRDDEGNPYGY